MTEETTTPDELGAASCSALVAMLADPEVRNQIDTEEKAQEVIDEFEATCDHGEMPEAYNWAVSRRNRLRACKPNSDSTTKVAD